MRKRRFKIYGREAVYHCISRTVGGELMFHAREKEVFRRMLWQAADFSGVEILSHSIQGNHFHVVVRVPWDEHVPDKELVRRYRALYPPSATNQQMTAEFLEGLLDRGGAEADAERIKLLRRMGDISEFMKTLKHRFSIWFNRTHGRYGTLWAERFKSLLVQGTGHSLQTVCAYVDLNPVRAGLVNDPKDYRFCGYGAAVAGEHRARRGILRIWAGRVPDGDVEGALRAHRMLMFGKGSATGDFKISQALRVLEAEQGSLSRSEVLRCRIRYFSDGAILGSSEFVRRIAAQWQIQQKYTRPAQPRILKGAEWGDLAVIRQLRGKVFG